MWRGIGVVTLFLSGVVLIGCLAGVVLIWVLRPSLLDTSAEIMARADSALRLAEEKTENAGELVKRIQAAVDPIASKILELANKPGRTPEEEQQVKDRIDARLEQVDSMASVAETAVTSLHQASLLANSFKARGSPPKEDSQDRTQSLAALAKALKEFREIIENIRDKKDVRKQVADDVLRLTRNVNENLTTVDARLKEIHERAGKLRTEVEEARLSIPDVVTRAAVVGSVLLVWLALGQAALAVWGCRTMARTRDE